jgi:hypothetical protein
MKTRSYLAAAIALLTPLTLRAQPLFSFESGTDGFVVSGFNAQPVALGTSPIGATHGSQALAITQTGGAFSWNAKRDNAGADAFYNAMNAAAANESLWTLEMDVTYRDADIPNGTFLNLSLWVNSDNTFRDIHSQAFTTTMEDKLVHLAIPLTSFSGTDELAVNSSFYQFGIGMNGNWGPGNATIYIDNIQLTLIPEPSTIALLVSGLGGLLLFRTRRARTRTPSP